MSDTFRLNCKRFLLTYPQYEAPKQELHEYLNRKLKQDTEVLIAHEHHEDGNIHTHACVKCPKKVDVKNADFFDYKGHHPNIRPPMTEQHWRNQVQYMRKEDPEPYGTLEVTLTAEEKFEAATQYVMNCGALRDIYRPGEHLRTISSKVTFFENLWKNQAKKKTTTAKYTEFNRPKIDNWTRSWLIYGDSGTGKTQYALSHFEKPLFVTHMDKLKEFDPNLHDGIVFDDISFSHLPVDAIIHILDIDNDRTIHCRFTTAEIPANTKKLFVHNRRDIFKSSHLMTEEQEDAIDRRLYVVHINAPLF